MWWKDDSQTETLCALAVWRAELDDAGRDPRDELAFQNQLADYAQVLRQQDGGGTKGGKPRAPPAEWQYQKEEAARAVRSLRGVKVVLNEIELKPTVSTTGVKIKIEDALKRDAQIEAKDIAVETSGSMVTLRGHVHTWNEREDAEHAAFSAPGVGSVSNLLTVSY